MYLSNDIIKEGNILLKQISNKVSLPLTSNDLMVLKGLYDYVIVSQIDDLAEQYKIRPGVGIAAPQVGVNKRMFAINFVDFLDEKQTQYCYAFINPIITKKSEQMVYLPGGEGCLSVDRPTEGMITPRHYSITFKSEIYDFVTNKVKHISKTFEGYPAIVFQHEYDHLDGILFTDKMYKTLPESVLPLYTIPDESESDEKKE